MGKKLGKKGGVVHVKGWHPDPRFLLIKNSSCLFFKESSFNLAYKMYVCVCKGFGMTTHMVQQITWANNRVPLLCQHRSYSTTKCLWSSWYHLEMGGTTLLAAKLAKREVGDNMTLTEFGRLLLACQNEKWHFYTLVEKHLTSRFAASWLFHQFIHRFSSRVLRAIKHRFRDSGKQRCAFFFLKIFTLFYWASWCKNIIAVDQNL